MTYLGASLMFPKRITFDEFVKTYPRFYEMLDKFDRLDAINDIKELIDLVEYFEALQTDFIKQYRDIFLMDAGVYRQKIVLDDEINLIYDRINEIGKLQYYYENDIIFDLDKTINGYKIPPASKLNIPFNFFLEWKDIWLDPTEMTYEEFSDQFDEIACTEWYKMDKYGECYGGFWTYPKNSYEYEHAWELSGEENCKALYELPYPKKFILETIKIGCSSRQESVPYSNKLCEWMSRMMNKLCSQQYPQKDWFPKEAKVKE